MYSRSYNKNNAPFTVPRQYSGIAFSRPKETDGVRVASPLSKPPVSYSREAGERLYAPGDFPRINVPVPSHEEKAELPERDRAMNDDGGSAYEETTDEKALEAAHRRPTFLNSLGALRDDTLMLLALILLLSGCEDAGDTVMILILLLLLG